MRQRVELESGFAYYDFEHYIKVRREREARGLSVKDEDHSKRIEDHPLIGRVVTANDEKGKTYTVDYAVKQWHWGFYITLALVDENRSHRCIMWETLGTSDETILESIAKNRLIFKDLQ